MAVDACSGCVKVGTDMQLMYVIMEECVMTVGTCTIEFMGVKYYMHGCVFSVSLLGVHYVFFNR
jgi:hypothetical protein